MDNKKLIQIIAILVAGIWIATIGTVIVLKTTNKEPTSSAPPPIFEPTGQVYETEYVPSIPQSTVPIGGNNVATTVKGTKPQWKVEQEASISASKKADKVTTTKKKTGIVPKGKEEIVKAYTRGINNLKNTAKFNMSTDSYFNISIDDVTGGSVVRSAVQKVIDSECAPESKSYEFKNGKSALYETPMEIVPPMGKRASLSPEIVQSASVNEVKGGGYTVTIKLKDEFQYESSSKLNHEGVIPVIHLEELMPTGASIKKYEILYSGTTLTATFDKNNRLVYLEHYLSVPSGQGDGTMTLIPVHLAMHGDYTATYEISY